MSTLAEIDRCHREIATRVQWLRDAYMPEETTGILLGLQDWRAELKMIEKEVGMAGMTLRELDAAIAELMGATGEQCQRWDLPRYSTDPIASHALKIFMRAAGWYLELCYRRDGTVWAWFDSECSNRIPGTVADTELRAVAESALATKGAK